MASLGPNELIFQGDITIEGTVHIMLASVLRQELCIDLDISYSWLMFSPTTCETSFGCVCHVKTEKAATYHSL